MDGWEPQINEVWAFGSDGITCEVHPTAQVYVGARVMGYLSSDYLTEIWRRIPILNQISINGSVEYLGIPEFHRIGEPFWDDNLLVPCYSWGDGGTTTNKNWGIQPGGPYESISVPRSRPVPIRLTYIPRSP